MTEFTESELRSLISNVVAEHIKPLAEVKREFTPAPTSPPAPEPEKVEPGVRFARFVMSLAAARNGWVGDDRGLRGAAKYAEERCKDSIVARALSASNLAEGGALIPEEFSRELIEYLREEAVVRAAGANVITIASDTILYPKQTSGAAAAYSGENVDIGKSEPAFGQLRAVGRKLTVLTPISNDLIRHAVFGAEQLVRSDLLGAIAEKEDITFIRSAGSEYQPKGIYFWVKAAMRANANSTINVANVNADLVNAIIRVRTNKKRFPRRGVWFFSPRTYGYLFKALDANSNPVWRDEMREGTLLGYPYFVTGQIPENLGTGSDETEVYFGDINDAIITQMGETRVDVTTEGAYMDSGTLKSAFSLDQTVIRVIVKHDFTLRYDSSFAVIEQVKWQ